MLEHRPVLPGRIVRMAAPNRGEGTRLQSDEHRTAPAFDQSKPETFRRGRGDRYAMRSRRHALEYHLYDPGGFDELIEAHGHACRDVTFGADDLARFELGVGTAGPIHAKIECLTAGAPRESREPEPRSQLGRDASCAGESIAHSCVLVVDRPKGLDFTHERGHAIAEGRRSERREAK